jgi:hypothetical protein
MKREIALLRLACDLDADDFRDESEEEKETKDNDTTNTSDENKRSSSDDNNNTDGSGDNNNSNSRINDGDKNVLHDNHSFWLPSLPLPPWYSDNTNIATAPAVETVTAATVCPLSLQSLEVSSPSLPVSSLLQHPEVSSLRSFMNFSEPLSLTVSQLLIRHTKLTSL